MKGKKVPKKTPCKNQELGCTISVFPKEMEKHQLVCLFQQIVCEGCGESMFLKDQVMHQKIKKCIEKKVKSDRICHAKRAHSNMMKYNQRMKSLKAGIEVMNWQRLKGLVHEKHGWTPRVPNAWGEEFDDYISPSPHSHAQMSTPVIEANDVDNAEDITEENRNYKDEDAANLEKKRQHCNLLSPTSNSPRSHTAASETISVEPGYTQKEHLSSTPQVTFADHNDYEDMSTIPCSTCETNKRSHSARVPSLCFQCGKFFRLSSNHDTACQYHEGPILKVHRMCAACGQLDHRPGCCKGPHIPLEINLEDRPQTPLEKQILLRKHGLSPRTASPMFLMKGEKILE